MSDNLLSDYRALDLTDEKGLLCGKILADLGVDVIKVEKPGGDSARNIPPFYHDEDDPEKSLYWFAFNTNKRGITLNLEISQGQDLFRKLVERADFVLESFPPGYMDRLGLGYENLSQVNPRIIMTSITPFGQSGPYSDFKASDLVAQAMVPFLIHCGDPDRAPVRVSVPQAYMHAGADAAEATMIADYYRDLTGEGQHIDVSVMESLMGLAFFHLIYWIGSRSEEKRASDLSFMSTLRQPAIWECKDGYVHFHLTAGLHGARYNRKLTRWMDSEQAAPRFMKEKDWESWDILQTTQAEMDSIVEAIALFFKSHTKKELQEEAIKIGLILLPLCDSADTVSNAQLKSRDFWVNIKHDELDDTITYPGAWAKFFLRPLVDRYRAPLIGEHNDDIYRKELGLSKDELTTLKVSGAI
jgi:crotonobetainyl-CoA:carnitine CoA-transferase CaiB-like acyl-CoA transferase